MFASLARLFVTATLVFASITEAETGNSRTERELQALVQDINTIEQWLGTSDKKLQALQDQLKMSDEQVSELGIQLFEAREEVKNAEQRIWDLEIQAQKLQDNRVTAWEQLAVQFRDAHHIAQTDPFKLFLNQENPDALTRLLKYYDYYNRALVKQIASFIQIEEDLHETIRNLTTYRDRLLVHVEKLELTKARFVDRRNARQDDINNYSKEINAIFDINTQLEENRQNLSSVIGMLQVQQPVQLAMPGLAAITNEGRFWPVDGTTLTQYGEALAGGRVAAEGMYVQATPGTPVYSAADGTVVFSDWIRGIGLLLVIDHGGRHFTLYGSCDSLFKHLGETVEGGEPVGLVGQSGGQPYVGLYFEVRQRGKPLNPVSWLGTKKTLP